MKRIAPRALGLFAAALLTATFAPSAAFADDGASARAGKAAKATTCRKVGRSGLVYHWKKDC